MYGVVFSEVRLLLRRPGVVPIVISAAATLAALSLLPLNIAMHALRRYPLIRRVRDELHRTVRRDIRAAAQKWT